LLPARTVPELRSAIPAWLETWSFSRYVTLTFNNNSGAAVLLGGSQLHVSKLRERVKKWDASVNHAILGRTWAKQHADRIFAFYALEKAEFNPHWHGLIRFFSDDPIEVARQELIFDREAGALWKKLVPAGSYDCQVVDNQRGVAEYISKTLQFELYYESFIVPDEFIRG
jgi:hypothetical protein